MLNIRRVYMYVVTAVSLNAVAWALIALLRNLFTPGLNPLRDTVAYNKETMALQLAIIIIGLPIYLAHWLWAERLAKRDEEEREAVLRFLYLYVMLTAFLAPFVANAYAFLLSGLRLLLNVEQQIPSYRFELPDSANLVYTLMAMIVLALLWSYHFWVVRINRRAISDPQILDTIHRLYIYLFSFTGLVMVSVGVGSLLRWLMYSLGSRSNISIDEGDLAIALAELIVGFSLWLSFWGQAQNLFGRGSKLEQASVLRKFYLYVVIFWAALGTVGSLTIILQGFLRRLFSLESQGDIRDVLYVLITTAVIWAYHFVVLRQDTRVMPEAAQQAGIRRLYWYLIAGIGLMALLIGIAGTVSVLIQSIFGQNESFVKDARLELLAIFIATTIAGLTIWIVPWQKIQNELTASELVGIQAQQSWVRRLYLYFYLLLATFTFLGTGVYVLSQIVLLLIGGRTSGTLASDMAHAIAFMLMAVAIWSYHFSLIRRDGETRQHTELQIAEAVHVVVVDDQDGRFGQKLVRALQQAIPNITLHSIGLTSEAAEILNNKEDSLPLADVLSNAQIIIGSWTIATPYVLQGETDMATLAAISSSPGQKLLIPKPEQNWVWAGVDEWHSDTAVKQTIRSVKQLIAGETVQAKKEYSLGTAIAIGFGIFALINLIPLLFLIPLIIFGI